MQQNKIAFFDVIRVIERASKEELKAIAGVEKAIINQATLPPRQRIDPRTGKKRASTLDANTTAGGDFVQINNTNIQPENSPSDETAHALSRTAPEISTFNGDDLPSQETLGTTSFTEKESPNQNLHVTIDPDFAPQVQDKSVTNNFTTNASENKHKAGDENNYNTVTNKTSYSGESTKPTIVSANSNLESHQTEKDRSKESHFTEQEKSNYNQEKIAASHISIQEKNNKLLEGLYLDSKGKLRQSNGAFATRKQKEAKAKENQEKMEGQSGIIAMLANWGLDKTKNTSDNQAVDTAGVAIGSSAWIAATEIASTANDARDFLVENNLNTTEGLKGNLKKGKEQLSNPLAMVKGYLSNKKDDDHAVNETTGINSSDKKTTNSTQSTILLEFSESPSNQETSIDHRTSSSVIADQSQTNQVDNFANTESKATTSSSNQVTTTLQPPSDSEISTSNETVQPLSVNDNNPLTRVDTQQSKSVPVDRINSSPATTEISTGTKKSRLFNNSDTQSSDSKQRSSWSEKGGSSTSVAKTAYSQSTQYGANEDQQSDIETGLSEHSTHSASQLSKLTSTQKTEQNEKHENNQNTSTSDSTSTTSLNESKSAESKRKDANRVNETSKSIDEQTRAINTNSSHQLDVLERMYNAIAAQSNSGSGVGSGLFGEDGVDLDRKKDGSKQRRGRRANRSRKKVSRLPSVLSTSGDLASSVLSKGSSIAGTAASGASAALKGVGKFVPLLAPALMAYDAFSGFTDAEKQKEVFDLKEGQEATTGQKSSMALANVLDMGGLVSGGAGLIGSGLGMLGFSGAQEALTFDSGSMAKSIYSFFSDESSSNTKERVTTDNTDSSQVEHSTNNRGFSNNQNKEEFQSNKHEEFKSKSETTLSDTVKPLEAAENLSTLGLNAHLNSAASSVTTNQHTQAAHGSPELPLNNTGPDKAISDEVSKLNELSLSSKLRTRDASKETSVLNGTPSSTDISPFGSNISNSTVSQTAPINTMFSTSTAVDNNTAYSTGEDVEKQSDKPRSVKGNEKETIIVQHDPKLNKTLDELLKVTKDNKRDSSTVIRYSTNNQSNTTNNMAQNKGGTGDISLAPTNPNLQVIAMDAE